jgi:hypothetical protein
MLLDAEGRRFVPTHLEVKEGGVTSVAYAPKGRVAAAYGRESGGGGVVLFDADPASWRRMAARVANRNFTHMEWVRYFPETIYRRTILSLPWPQDLPEEERKQAEEFEKDHPEGMTRLESVLQQPEPELAPPK